MSKPEVFTADQLKAAAAHPPPFLVDGLIEQGSINLLVGGSGLGKTPFCVQMALCVATGTPFLGRETVRRKVLYCDAESGIQKFEDHLATLSRFLGIRDRQGFSAWSPTWVPAAALPGERLLETVRQAEPDLVIVDPLRSFFDSAEGESTEAARLYQRFRAYPRVTWIIVHHTRKPSQDGTARLDNDPFGWMHEAAGTAALVNHADGRLGIELASPSQPFDALMSGYIRSLGVIPATRIQRIQHPDYDDPLGYAVVQDASLLGKPFVEAVRALGPKAFRFSDLKRRLVPGMSPNTISKRLREAQIMKLINRVEGGYLAAPGLGGVGDTAGQKVG